jgi:hypothetical protein
MKPQSKNKILIVSSFFPFPSFFGGAYDVFERIKGLKSLGFEIDLICTCKAIPKKEDIDFIKTYIEELFLVERKNRLPDLFNLKPLQVISRKELKNVVLHQKYNYTILESECVGLILENKSLRTDEVIVRVHNNESKYFKELANSTHSFFNKLYYSQESFKYKYFSSNIFSKADRLWFISKEELVQNDLNASMGYKSIHLPSPINDPFLKQELSSKTVLFIGALFMPNNIQALLWYLDFVHPFLLKKENYKLIIVGSTGDYPVDYFSNKFKNYSNIELFFNANELDLFYAQSTVFINPMLHGTGVKLKSINAIVNGLPLVATTIGAEGIGLDEEMYFEANTPTEFITSILDIFNLSPAEKQVKVSAAQNYLLNINYLTILKKELRNA